MATVHSTDTAAESPPLTTSIKWRYSRLYRAHIEATDSRVPDRTAFIEASNTVGAVQKLAQLIAILELSTPEACAERICNCFSAAELIDEGVSEDLELRLFETGWCGARATYFVREPLFLLRAPAALARKWAAIPGGAS